MNRSILSFAALVLIHQVLSAETHEPLVKDPAIKAKSWSFETDFSDEFSKPVLRKEKWDNNPKSWGPWSWDPSNAFVKDGNLFLRMVQETHQRGEAELFYKSGIVRSRKKITYGYFEARIKGCSKFPGACPSFWLYSHGPEPKGKVKYSEIDIVELQQGGKVESDEGESPVNKIDMNLHYKILNDQGVVEFRRPRSEPDLCMHHWTAPWDPRDDFHVYACEVTKESITWLVDGVVRVRQKNPHWHLPMSITLSMGLRPPFVVYREGERFPNPKATTGDGFPTEMVIDYVRVWTDKHGPVQPSDR